jgi:hypothetical protein
MSTCFEKCVSLPFFHVKKSELYARLETVDKKKHSQSNEREKNLTFKKAQNGLNICHLYEHPTSSTILKTASCIFDFDTHPVLHIYKKTWFGSN